MTNFSKDVLGFLRELHKAYSEPLQLAVMRSMFFMTDKSKFVAQDLRQEFHNRLERPMCHSAKAATVANSLRIAPNVDKIHLWQTALEEFYEKNHSLPASSELDVSTNHRKLLVQFWALNGPE